jgi:tetratricopeptide (TPR) repeat protein
MELAKECGDAPASEDADKTKSAAEALATVLGGGEGAADAKAKLLEDKAAAKAVFEQVAKQATGLSHQLILIAIDQGLRSGARYAGQYTVLVKLGDGVAESLVGLVENPPQGASDSHRGAMLAAVRDVAKALDEKLMKRIASIADDEFEETNVQQNAAYVLYQFGDKKRVGKRTAELLAETKTEGRELGAWTALADIYAQGVRDYDKAIDAYKNALKIQENPTLLYNLACAQSLAGKLDDAFASLDKALEDGQNLSDTLLATDHDINNLRKDPRFKEILGKHGRTLGPGKSKELKDSEATEAGHGKGLEHGK